ncbi:alpha/beta hydrolase [Allorhodopirellula solitaria]|uniref:Acetylxylan esterase n=1 Tax=Allorhodopirellula solitaria TaxID=2527987 RepID=A0A5C5YK36_9BACT|nr:alpha/beta hydrolase [Allorhodopirellula solitaria]TWT75197.1 Acetylxylan esterase precursor [Allorhodopirellula solitaria]
MRTLLVAAIPLALCLTLVSAEASEPQLLWPDGAPGDQGELGPEHDKTSPDETSNRVIRLGNVSEPTITLYRAPAEKDNGSAVVVCPGGGYHILAMDLEGTEVCQWLNTLGVNAVLLKYRVPRREGRAPHEAPLQDVQRALGLVRWHADEWNLNPERIGVLGFSAGGHLSAAASTNYGERTYEAIDEADTVSCRPDFAVLIYPAYLTKKRGPELAPELTVTKDTPPTFLFQTQDDGVHVEGSLFYYLALTQSQVAAEMHLLAEGGHGYGLRGSERAPQSWPKYAEAWMRGLGVIE